MFVICSLPLLGSKELLRVLASFLLLPRKRSKEETGASQVKGLIYIGSFLNIHLWNSKL